MANITVKDLTTSNPNNLNRNLSESELTLQGGCVGKVRVAKVIVANSRIVITYDCILEPRKIDM
jgi:ABC-type transport system involved in Fe-S cluster assembly fused permease/ATPase subunit